MAACAPQRFLANNRNAVRTALLTPSSVQAVSDSVLETSLARDGTAQVALTGAFTGVEEAIYDIEVLDATVGTKLISAPVFSGVGSGTLSGISSSATAQTYSVELGDNGIPVTFAGVDFEGVRLVARASGSAGNLVNITIDQTTLTVTDTSYSLIDDLKAGAGSETQGLEGPAYDWQTAVLGADNLIPSSAKRVVFGDDIGAVYLQYKKYVDAKWLYYFVPEIKRDIRKGTAVRFVTGGRAVAVTNGTTTENYTGIATLYDLLNAIKTGSALLDVVGVIANDRSPTGQASRDLQTRTDAHVQPSTGAGSDYATGFVDTFANSGAATELVTAKCYAVTSKDHPLAHLGAERWEVSGSLSGDLGIVVTGEPFTDPTGKFGFTIPTALPPDSETAKGRFSATGVSYVGRDPGVELPPLCPAGLLLGPDATDQTITLTYTKRPTGDCLCLDLPVPNLATACLGIIGEGEGTMTYQAANVTRLTSLYDWAADTVRDNSFYASSSYYGKQAPFVAAPGTAPGFAAESLFALMKKFEETLALVDALPAGAYYTSGTGNWDTVVTELKADVDALAGASQSGTYVAHEALAARDCVGLFVDNSGVVKVRKAIAGCIRYGFVTAAVSAAATATVYFWGHVTGMTGLTPTDVYAASAVTPGAWTNLTGADQISVNINGTAYIAVYGTALSATEINVQQQNQAREWASLLSDRYKARLSWVLMSAGISPLGKSSASVLESGDGCWQDYGDAYYWEVVGSGGGAYAPAFNNHPYYSARRASDKDKYFSTHEFAFQINVKCPQLLLEGDQITLSISDAGAAGGTYQVGDTLTLPVIAAQALYLAGGQAGSKVQKWYVSGSVSGAMAQYTFDPDTPVAYSSVGLTFLLVPGGIPFEKGDRFTFGIEGGHFKWRKTVGGVAGAWSASTAIPAAPALLDAGLSIGFTTGATPSFVAGDLFQFTVLQPWAVSNLTTPSFERWQWTGAAPTLVADLGTSQSISMAALALHTLPTGTTITLEGGTTPGVYTWSETLTWQAGTIVKEFAAQTARYLRLTLGSATGGGIGWLWAGTPLTTSLAASVQLRRQYKVARGDAGLYEGGLSLAKSVGGSVSWSEGAMNESDMTGLTALLDWIKSADDEPFILVPQITRPTEVLLARVVTDEVDLVDVYDYQPASGLERRFSAELPLSGVWQ